jgi:hypothetical protein
VKTGEQLILAAAKLAGGAAGNWDEFLVALRAYKDDQLNLMAKAPPDKVQNLQGRAHHAIDLVEMFESCRDKARLILESQDAKR